MRKLMQNYRKLTINLKKKLKNQINNKINNNSHRNQNLRILSRNAMFNAFANNALKSMKNGDIN